MTTRIIATKQCLADEHEARCGESPFLSVTAALLPSWSGLGLSPVHDFSDSKVDALIHVKSTR